MKGKYIPFCLFDLAQRLRSLLMKSFIKIKKPSPLQHAVDAAGYQDTAIYLIILIHFPPDLQRKLECQNRNRNENPRHIKARVFSSALSEEYQLKHFKSKSHESM